MLKKKVVPEAVAVEEVVEEEVVEEAVEKPAVESAPSDEERVLEVIARHPEGIKLVDIGNELGVNWRSFIGTTKSLVDEGKVEKIDTVYYPRGGPHEEEGARPIDTLYYPRGGGPQGEEEVT